MSDVDYSYLANRLVAEQACARTATCIEAATAHQNLANAYRVRLQSLILTPDMRSSQECSLPNIEWAGISPLQKRLNDYLDMRIADAQTGNSL